LDGDELSSGILAVNQFEMAVHANVGLLVNRAKDGPVVVDHGLHIEYAFGRRAILLLPLHQQRLPSTS
jgi:hypothetical protein